MATANPTLSATQPRYALTFLTSTAYKLCALARTEVYADRDGLEMAAEARESLWGQILALKVVCNLVEDQFTNEGNGTADFRTLVLKSAVDDQYRSITARATVLAALQTSLEAGEAAADKALLSNGPVLPANCKDEGKKLVSVCHLIASMSACITLSSLMLDDFYMQARSALRAELLVSAILQSVELFESNRALPIVEFKAALLAFKPELAAPGETAADDELTLEDSEFVFKMVEHCKQKALEAMA